MSNVRCQKLREKIDMWVARDRAEKPLVSYSGSLPPNLYRYRSVSPDNLDRIIDFEIIEEGIYLAGLKDLNDPDEGRFLVIFEGTREEIAAYWKQTLASARLEAPSSAIDQLAYKHTDEIIRKDRHIPKHVIAYTRHVFGHVLRVACFTTLPTNYSMGANYARYSDGTTAEINHGGICIEYRCDDSWRNVNLHPVMYSDDVPKINPVSRNESEFIKAIYSKSSEWRCEDEWRIFMIIQSMPPFPKNLTANSKLRAEGSVSGVIFGLQTPDHIVEEVLKRVKQSGATISFRRVVHDPTTYQRVLKSVG